jgi:hypothetical protein
MASGELRLVHGMPCSPHVCIACQQRSTEDNCVDLGTEFDWGEQAYLCPSCARVIGELQGLMDPKHNKKLEKKVKDQKAQIEALTEERDTAQSRIDRMIDGVRAKKEAQSG